MCNFYKSMNKYISQLGELLFVISILVLVASFIFSMFYLIFFYNEDEYLDFNNGLLYIGFWIVLLAVGVKIVDKSPNSFLKSDSKETKSKKEE